MWPTFAPTATGLPGLELAQIMDLALQFLVAMLRIGAFVMAAPLFGAQYIALPVRIMIAVCLTLPLIGQVPIPPAEALAGLGVPLIVLAEVAIGLAAGLILQIVFTAAMMAGDRIANTAGLGLAAQIDPATGAQSPVIGQFFALFLIGLFVATDTHLAVIRLLLDSYRHVPIGAVLNPAAFVDAGATASSAMFHDAARLMMPIVIVLLVVNIVIGVITRSAPQLNIFAFGFPLTMTVTLLMLWLTAPVFGPALAELLDNARRIMAVFLAGLSDG